MELARIREASYPRGYREQAHHMEHWITLLTFSNASHSSTSSCAAVRDQPSG